jgi:hypothetical protein
MDTRASRRPQARRPPGLVNRIVLALLHSPVHWLLDPGVCELRYRGRRTGRPVALPVLYAAYGERYVVVVGDAADKHWWRNFIDPLPVQVGRGRRSRAGTCRVVSAGDPDYEPAWRAYVRRQRIPYLPGDRLLLIDFGGASG